MNRTFLRHARAPLGILALCLGLAGCTDDTPPTQDTPAPFFSVKPGSAAQPGAKNGQGEAATGAAPADTAGDKAAKVEEGDVARLAGTTLYVLNQWRGLQIVDVANPAAPKLLHRVAMTGIPREMYVQGDEAVVLLSQVASLQQVAGKPVATAGSLVHRVALAGKPQIQASFALPGYIATSKRIGNQLVVVAPQVSWNPWWGGCWGPYACAADVATGSAGKATAGAAADVAVAYPGGGSGGWDAAQTRIAVLDLAQAGALAEVGHVDIDGGVLEAAIGPGEVLVASQAWQWSGDQGTITERLTQVVLGAGGKPGLGAATKNDTGWSGSSSQSLQRAFALGAGRLGLVRQIWSGNGQGLHRVESWHVQGGTWQQGASWQKATSGHGVQVAAAGTEVLVASATGGSAAGGSGGSGGVPGKDTGGGATDEDGGAAPGTDGEPDDPPDPDGVPGGTDLGLGIDVLDLADPATAVLASHLELAEGGWNVYGTQLAPLQPGRWLVATRGYAYTEQHLRVLDTTQPAAAKWLGAAKIASQYGMPAEILGPGLLAVAVQAPTGSGGKEGTGGEQVGMRLVTVAADGAVQVRGLFASGYLYWYQLKNLLADQTLYRIAAAGLEIVDLADLDAPKVYGAADLAAEVVDVAHAGGQLVALVRSWQDGKTWLRVLPTGGTDELQPVGQVAVPAGWGRLYSHGAFVYVAGDQGVHVFDVSNPAAPKARGTWQAPQASGSGPGGTWWNTWTLAQQGPVLYLTGTQVTYAQGTAKDCAQGVPGSSGGSSTPPSEGAAPMPDKAGEAPQDDPSDGTDGDSATPEELPAGTDTCWLQPTYVTRLAALDLGNPDAPALAGQVDLPGVSWVSFGELVGKDLYLTHYESLQGADGQWLGQYWLDRVDLGNPVAPKLAAQINVPGWLVGVSADGSRAVTLDWQPAAGTKPEQGQIENVLHSLTLAGDKATIQASIPLGAQAGATLRHGDTVYVSTWPYWWLGAGTGGATASELRVFSQDGKGLQQVGQVATGAAVSWLQVADGHLFAGLGGGLGMTAWSIAQPTQPTFQAFLPTQGGWSPRVLVQGQQAIVPAGWHGIEAHALAP